MNKGEVADIIKEQGYHPEFRFVFSKKGFGKNQLWVIARKGRHNRWLGIYQNVRAMDAQGLSKHIETKFKAPTR